MVHASVRTEHSSSRQLGYELVANWHQQFADLLVTQRDLNLSPLPHFSDATYAAFSGELESAASQQALALSESLIHEFEQADAVVFTVPVYNWSIPSTLKAYIDHLARSGRSFHYVDGECVGLLADKPVYLVIASGGAEIGSTENQLIEPLAMMGVTDVTTLHASHLDTQQRAQKLAEIENRVSNLVDSAAAA